MAFNVLGIDNDSRGGDSCGIFIDGQVEYGVDKLKYYENFYSESKLLKNTKKATIALGHCRKASVGAINASTAQPVVIRENGEIKFVLLHNGTIYNYQELAVRYIPNIDITNMTDSQVMAHIFYYTGYDVLKDYTGGGVFVAVDYRGNKPITYIFKGESKAYNYSKDISEERPFYFVKTNEVFVFSSIASYLPVLYPGTTVRTFNGNTLISFSDKGFKKVAEYDRSDKVQAKVFNTNPNPNYSNSFYGRYWDDDDVNDYYGTNNKSKPNNLIPYQSRFIIYCDREGRFTRGGLPLHGEVILDANGTVKDIEYVGSHKFYFWNGYLLYGADYFDALQALYETLACQDPADLLLYVPEVIMYFSPLPMKCPEIYDDDKYRCSKDGTTSYLYTGDLSIPFTYTEKSIKAGIDFRVNKCISNKESFRNILLKLEAPTNINIIDDFI